MPLKGTHGALGRKLARKLVSKDAPTEFRRQIERQWTDIAEIIIGHIIENADVETVVETRVKNNVGAQIGFGEGDGRGTPRTNTGIK